MDTFDYLFSSQQKKNGIMSPSFFPIKFNPLFFTLYHLANMVPELWLNGVKLNHIQLPSPQITGFNFKTFPGSIFQPEG